MRLQKIFIGTIVCLISFNSCVSKKTLKEEKARNESLLSDRDKLQEDLLISNNKAAAAERSKEQLQSELTNMQRQVDFVKENNDQMLKQLQNLSVISGSQAESIKKSLDNIGAKDVYIQMLQSAINQKDSLNMVLVMNLKGAIGNLNDKDINIKVEKGVVYIDISDKLLFKSGKYEITDNAKEVLGKVALVLKNQPDIEFMVEGHTDNVPYKGGGAILDNWDLSVKRATAVVRVLQNQYGLNPSKISAAGRAEYKPIADNSTDEGKSANRRTRIVILPQLDQFFKLLERKS